MQLLRRPASERGPECPAKTSGNQYGTLRQVRVVAFDDQFAARRGVAGRHVLQEDAKAGSRVHRGRERIGQDSEIQALLVACAAVCSGGSAVSPVAAVLAVAAAVVLPAVSGAVVVRVSGAAAARTAPVPARAPGAPGR